MPDELDPGVLYGPDDDRTQPPPLLRACHLDATGSPWGEVALVGIVPGSLRIAMHDAALQMDVPIMRMADMVREVSFPLTNVHPELLALLTGCRVPRGWKGHGAPRLYQPDMVDFVGGAFRVPRRLLVGNVHDPRPRKRHRPGWR